MQVHLAVHKMFIFCYLFIVVNDNDGDSFFSFNVIYDYMNLNINKVLDYKGRALGAATFFVRLGFFFFLPPCEVHLCTFFFLSFLKRC